MIKAEWTSNDALSTEQTTQTNAHNTLNSLDCISRQAAIDALEGEIEVIGKANAEAVLKYTKMVCNRIKALPSAQPERKRGKWINDNGLYRCSSCNQLLAEWWAVSKPIEFMKEECPYCPLCGSYNGEEKTDNEA